MSYMRPVDAATTAEWPDLIEELDRWEAEGRVAALWWRDDDATTATPELAALLRLAAGVPVALAVIPAMARPELAARLAAVDNVVVLQHGWQHHNHAQQGKKSEYPADRPAISVAVEIAAGRTRLETMFGRRALPVLVPPWNRFAEGFLPLLPDAGIRCLSAMARPAAEALPPEVAALDVHVDPINWRGGRGFIGTSAALGRLLGHLQASRFGAVGATLPIGILTHHLVQDDATTAFLERLVALVADHPGARWAAVREFVT